MILADLFAAAPKSGGAVAMFVFTALVGLVSVAAGLLHRRFLVRPPNERWTGSTGDSPNATAIDSEQLSQAVDTLLGKDSPEAKALKSLKGYFPAGSTLPATVRRAGSVDPNSPFPVVIQVRKALEAQQLDSVRHLLSDHLYQRLAAAPPVPPVAVPDRLFMITRKHPGDDPNRVIVRIGGSVAVPGATAEDWTMVRASNVSTAVPVPPTTPAPLSACPYCAAQLDAGATHCRYCGMDVTLAMPVPAQPPQTAAAAAHWIVDDVSAANPMAA